MKNFLRNFLHYPLSFQYSFLVIQVADYLDPKNLTLNERTRWLYNRNWISASRAPSHSNNSCTRILLTLLLVFFPLLASPTSTEDIEENCNYEYYPKLDDDAAAELYVIKRNYYRYGEKLKILADKRIKEIKFRH